MKAFVTSVVCGLVLAVAASVALAAEDDKKEVTLKGEFGCGKCVFKLDKKITGGKCTNAIQVVKKEGDKEVKTVYVLKDEGGKETYHKAICTGKKKGSVTGVVSKEGDQYYITPKKDGVKYDE